MPATELAPATWPLHDCRGSDPGHVRAPFPSWSIASLIPAFAPALSSIWEDDTCRRFSLFPRSEPALGGPQAHKKRGGLTGARRFGFRKKRIPPRLNAPASPPRSRTVLERTDAKQRGARLDWRSSGRVSYPRLSLRKRGNRGFLRNGRKDIWSVVGAGTPKSSYSLQVSGSGSRDRWHLTRPLLDPGPAF